MAPAALQEAADALASVSENDKWNAVKVREAKPVEYFILDSTTRKGDLRTASPWQREPGLLRLSSRAYLDRGFCITTAH